MTTICRDALALESVAAQTEITLLASMKVGDTRPGALLPALEVDMVWTLTVATVDRWEFEGRFFGQPLYHLTIRVQGPKLTLDVETLDVEAV